MAPTLKHSEVKLDSSVWCSQPEWEGLRGTRRLFDVLTGMPAHEPGALGAAWMYRGLPLARLFEGAWITLTWPAWFGELAAWDCWAQAQPGAVVDMTGAPPLRQVAARCVQARHPGVRFIGLEDVPATWPLEGDAARIRSHRLYRVLRAAMCVGASLRAGQGRALPAGNWVFCPWSAKIAPHMLPVAEECARRRPGRVAFAGWGRAPAFRSELSAPWIDWGSGRGLRLLAQAWRATAALRRSWSQARDAGALESLADWRGWDMRPLVLPLLDCAQERLLPVLLNVLAVEARLRRERPEVVVLPYDGGQDVRVVAAGARLAGVPCAAVQYGHIVEAAELSAPFEDLVFLQGGRVREWLLARQADDRKLAVVGSPAVDRLFSLGQRREGVRANLAQRLHLDPARPWVVAATWPAQAIYSRELKQREAELVCEAVRAAGDVELIFKLHPSDREAGAVERAEAAKQGWADVCLVADVTLNDELLVAADVLISNFSTIGTIAVVLRTPLVILTVVDWYPGLRRAYVDDGVALYATDRESLGCALRQALAGRESFWNARLRDWERYMEQQFYRTDGRAAQRICDGLESLVAARGRASPGPTSRSTSSTGRPSADGKCS